MKQPNYTATVRACFIGYIVQAIVNNFVPLLLLMFQTSYGIPLSKITMLITFNFGIQLLVDLISIGFVDRIGYRASALLAHGFSAAGLVLLTILPDAFADPFVGLLIAVTVYAIGGGLLEVLISPIVEACPSDNKSSKMSLLHSFYCWGSVGVVLISTLFFKLFGINNWKIIAIFWALIPIGNAFVFAKVPIAPLITDGETGLSIAQLAKNKTFWVMLLLMICAGASEQSVSQWASTFAENGLGISKAMGDLAGPMMFSLLMGLSRALYGKYGDRVDLNRFMLASTVLCVCSYLLIALCPIPALGLVGCGLCGLSVGILWPGLFSTAAAAIRGGGTAMFAFLALAGDLGCSGGPTVVGMVSGALSDNLRLGILAAVAFPAILVVCLMLIRKARNA